MAVHPGVAGWLSGLLGLLGLLMRYLERILGANAKNNSPVTYIDVYIYI